MVITKIDMCPPNVLEETVRQVSKVLKSSGCRKTPVFIKSLEDVCIVTNHFVADR
jgi:GTPase